MGNVTNENKGFESISRDLIFDNTLSDRARFVYVYMSAKPEGWDFFISHMCKELGYSENTLRKYIDELIKTGWLERHEQKRNNDGTMGAVQYIIKSSNNSNRPQFDRGTNFTVRQKNRDGKIGTQRNIDNKEIKNNNKEINNLLPQEKKPQNEQGNKPDFKALFIEQAKKMETDENLQMSLAYLKITNFKELANQFYKHIINTVQQAKFIKNGYTNNCRWLKFAIPDLDLSKARGKELGPGEMIDDDGNRYYINQWSGTKIIVPDDAPPRPSKNHIWARSEGCWITN